MCADYSLSIPDAKTTTVWSALASFFSTPLNGPNRFGLWIETDPVYKFQLLFQTPETAKMNMYSAEFTWDAPNPKHPNRQVKIRAEAGLDPKVFAKITLISPIRSSSAEVGFDNNVKEVVVYGQAEDNGQKYLAKFGLTKSAPMEYTPIFLIQYPDRTENGIFGYAITGKILVSEKAPETTYTFKNLEIRETKDNKDVGADPLLINGNVVYVPISFKVNVDTVKGGSRVHVEGKLDVNPQNFLIDFKTESNKNDLVGELFYNFQYEKNAFIAQTFKVKKGTKKDYDLSASQRLEFDKKVLDEKKTEDYWGALTKVDVKANWLPMYPGEFEVSYNNDKNMNYDNLVRIKCHNLDLVSSMILKKPKQTDYDFNYSITVNKFFVKVLSKLASDGSNGDLTKKNFVNKVSLSNGFAFDLNGNFANKLKTGDFDLDFVNQLTDNTKKPQYKVTFNLKNTLKQLNWNLKVNLMAQPTDIVTGTFTLTKAEQFVLEMVVRDILVLTTDFKFAEIKAAAKAEKNGVQPVNFKGDGFVLVKFPKVNNYQVKVNSKFLMNEPNYDVDLELFYDFERDNTKKATFNTKNVVKKNEVQTK